MGCRLPGRKEREGGLGNDMGRRMKGRVCPLLWGKACIREKVGRAAGGEAKRQGPHIGAPEC